jgi:3-oxoadipate enol-lactonase
MGGLIAQWFAIHHPERVESAVFANSAARLGTEESWNSRIQMIRDGGMAGIRDMVMGRFFHAEFRARHPEIVRTFSDILMATPPEGYIAACGALRDADQRGKVSSIRLPVLVIAGSLDEATPPTQSAELAAAIPGSLSVVLDDAAHLSNVEQAEAFSRCLLEFLAKP